MRKNFIKTFFYSEPIAKILVLLIIIIGLFLFLVLSDYLKEQTVGKMNFTIEEQTRQIDSLTKIIRDYEHQDTVVRILMGYKFDMDTIIK